MYNIRPSYFNIRRKLCKKNFSLVQKYKNTACVDEGKNIAQKQLSEVCDRSTIQSSVGFEKSKRKHSFPALVPSEINKLCIIELNESIISAEDTDTLFNIYLQNKISYDLDQYNLTTERLSHLFKTSVISATDLHQDDVFQSLCYDIWKVTSQMEASMVLNFYKNFLNVNVRSSSLVMQSLLQMTRHQINLLTIKELIFLHVLLNNTEPCNLKDALQLALPRVIENCINLEVPLLLKYSEVTLLLKICIIGEVDGLSRVLNHIYRHALPGLLTNKESPSFNLDLISLLSNLLTLFLKEDCPLSEKDLEVVNILIINCLNQLVERDFSDVDWKLILILLRKLGNSYNCGSVHSFHEDFLSKVVQRSIAENWDLESLCEIIDSQLSMHCVNDDLVTFVVSKLNESSDEILRSEINIPPLIYALAASNLPLHESNKIARFLMSKFTAQFTDLKIPWLRLALNLLSLNYYPESLLGRILDQNFLLSYFNFRRNAHREFLDLLRLDRVLKSLEWPMDLRVPNKLRSMAEASTGTLRSFSLRNALEYIIGDSQCLASNVITPNKNNIDHLIVMGKDGRLTNFVPMDLDCDSAGIKFSDLKKIDGKRKIALVEVPESWTYKPGLKLRGSFKLELQLIEKEGFEVLPFYHGEIEALQAEEVADYMREKLRRIGVALS